MIYDAHPDSLVEVWILNEDSEANDLVLYTDEYNLHIPIMYGADDAFDRYRLGRQYHVLPPLYIIIDKHGIVRHRSWRRGGDPEGKEKIEELVEIVNGLLEED